MQNSEKIQSANKSIPIGRYPIDRCNAPSIEYFNENYLTKHKPVIISNSLKWPALQKWNPEYLKEIYSDKIVDLTIFNYKAAERQKEFKNSELELPRLEFSSVEVPKVEFSSAIDLIYTNSDPKKKHYLMQNSISENFAELFSDIDLPPYANKDHFFYKNIWISESGINSRPHYDYAHNFLTQIAGRKLAKLYSPSDSPNMYSYPIKDDLLKNKKEKSAVHFSRIIDTDQMNYEVYPNFRHVTCFEGILNPGDLLFIPNGWWHEIITLDTSISVNFWWLTNFHNLHNLQLSTTVCSTFYWHNNMFSRKIREYFDLSEFENDLQISEFALTKNLLCVSAIFLLSYINDNFDSSNEKVQNWKRYLEVAIEGEDHLVKHQEILSIIKDIKNS